MPEKPISAKAVQPGVEEAKRGLAFERSRSARFSHEKVLIVEDDARTRAPTCGNIGDAAALKPDGQLGRVMAANALVR